MSITDRVRSVVSFAGRPPAGSDERDETTDDGETLGVAIDDAFHVLRDKRRRRVLRHVRHLGDGETVSLNDLARILAGQEEGVAPEHVSTDKRKTVYVSLYQCHLATLNEHGAITWDGKHSISRGPETEALNQLLDFGVGLQRGEA